VHAMPALLRSAGLSQALHFVRSRPNDDQALLLEHLAAQLRRVDPKIQSTEALLDAVRRAELGDYLRLTHEALACVSWYRRFVQGELNVDPGEDR
jgi:CRISPR-associated protein Cmr5